MQSLYDYEYTLGASIKSAETLHTLQMNVHHAYLENENVLTSIETDQERTLEQLALIESGIDDFIQNNP